MQPVQVAYVGLGANIGDPEAQLGAALASLDRLPATRVLARSRLYRSPPWGVVEQPPFVNAVAALETTLTAREMLEALLAIERAAGRERRERWGPRVLDLDLLLHGDAELDQPGLRLPHPQLHRRAFVLVPLAEIAPDLLIPGRGALAVLLRSVDCAGVEALG